MHEKLKSIFILPVILQAEFKEIIRQNKYTQKEKNQCVSETLQKLLLSLNLHTLKKFNDRFQKLESIMINQNIKKQCEDAIVQTR